MTQDSVSVIIPAYQAARTIGRALDSVLAQTRAPYEVLIVDDGSPDEEELLAALEPYRGRVTLIRKPNGGAASARNLGIDRSRGSLIAFLDADDYWEPEKLERQCDVFHLHPEVGLVAARYFLERPGPAPGDGSRFPATTWFGTFPEDRVLRPSGEGVFRIAMAVWTSTVVLRREVLGPRRFETDLRTAEDRDLWMRLIASGPVYVLSGLLATGVMEPQSLSRSGVDVDFENMLQVVRRYRGLLGPGGLRRWEATFFQLWASCQLAAERPGAALRPAWERLRREPLSLEGWYIVLKSAALAYSPLGNRDRPDYPEPGRLAPDLRAGGGGQ